MSLIFDAFGVTQEGPQEQEGKRRRLEEQFASARTDTISAVYGGLRPSNIGLIPANKLLAGEFRWDSRRPGSDTMFVQERDLESEQPLRGTLAHEWAHLANSRDLPEFLALQDKLISGAEGKYTKALYDKTLRASAHDPLADAAAANLDRLVFGDPPRSTVSGRPNKPEDVREIELAPTMMGVAFQAIFEAGYLMDQEGMTSQEARKNVGDRLERYLPGSRKALDYWLGSEIYEGHPLSFVGPQRRKSSLGISVSELRQ